MEQRQYKEKSNQNYRLEYLKQKVLIIIDYRLVRHSTDLHFLAIPIYFIWCNCKINLINKSKEIPLNNNNNYKFDVISG